MFLCLNTTRLMRKGTRNCAALMCVHMFVCVCVCAWWYVHGVGQIICTYDDMLFKYGVVETYLYTPRVSIECSAPCAQQNMLPFSTAHSPPLVVFSVCDMLAPRARHVHRSETFKSLNRIACGALAEIACASAARGHRKSSRQMSAEQII